MRIRSTKPEFWRSRRIASVDWETRFVLKGLESYVDDNGVGKDDIELIVSDIFSRDLIREPSGTVKRVTEAVTRLSGAGLLHRYEAEGTDYLYISWWDSNQYINKPTKGRFRRPDGTLNYGESAIGSSLRNPPEDSSNAPVGTGEQGNRGTGEQGNSLSRKTGASPNGFDAFWGAYAKKVGRKAAAAKYALAIKKPGVTPELLLDAASEYVAYQRAEGKHPTYTKDPAHWLNGEHWMDERAAPSRPQPQPSKAEQRMRANLAMVEQLRAEEATQLRAIEGN